MQETRKMRSARKRLELVKEFEEFLFQNYKMQVLAKKEDPFKEACRDTDLYIAALISKKPQDKTLVLQSAREFAKIVETALEKIATKAKEDMKHASGV